MTIKKNLLKTCIAGSGLVLSRPPSAYAFVEISRGSILRVKGHADIRNVRLIIAAARKDDDSLLDAEDAAAFDAHDLSDPGMEAAAMERALMMAEEFKVKQSIKQHPRKTKQTKAATIGGKAHDMQTNQDDSLSDAEDAAAFDAHDLSDPGMEAAAMERAVMMAEEFKIDQYNTNKTHKTKQITVEVDNFFLPEVHTDEGDSLLDAEDAAAFDAHDLSDPGVEAAAMERAVMIANELTNKHTKKTE
ncbi:hypothetical protein HJC23_008614 [Cyclotella cryptica]|uniref:Uncharacterized protein n=1 Tax=Cyclotella cryptica TaxID=29204 RepID=A0ABD3Q8K7_9STRA|eukprot:CCRYP_007976-RA/>CCRYP_007976-RA protein AED:0.17 eAED:0.17 QI:0/-1/0/1/-1/1/1/0/245